MILPEFKHILECATEHQHIEVFAALHAFSVIRHANASVCGMPMPGATAVCVVSDTEKVAHVRLHDRYENLKYFFGDNVTLKSKQLENYSKKK